MPGSWVSPSCELPAVSSWLIVSEWGTKGGRNTGKASLKPVELAKRIVEIAADKQATDVVLLDTRKACSFADYFIICSGDSDRQLEAIHRAIVEALKAEGDVHYHSEGTAASGWMLLDLGNIVVHIFSTAERDLYQLESLWSAAPVIVKMI